MFLLRVVCFFNCILTVIVRIVAYISGCSEIPNNPNNELYKIRCFSQWILYGVTLMYGLLKNKY